MDGYMIDVQCDADTLRVKGKNKTAQMALAGKAWDEGDVVIPRSSIATVTFKGASMMVNGNLIVTTTNGGKYQMHFRKKQQGDFRDLAQQLGVVLA